MTEMRLVTFRDQEASQPARAGVVLCKCSGFHSEPSVVTEQQKAHHHQDHHKGPVEKYHQQTDWSATMGNRTFVCLIVSIIIG